MTKQKILYLFPDTNVFLQCKPLDQVNWSILSEWDEFHLVISRPVQTEIDAFKGKGNSRQASRARKATTLIRKLLRADDYRVKLREHPTVYLCLRHTLRRDVTVADILDYQERDDQLVGIALAFKKAHCDVDVRLMTNDTGPMASAQAVKLNHLDVPDEWMLPIETDEADKRVKSLEQDLQRYKQAEPNFDVKVLPEEQIKSSVKKYSDLTGVEVQQFLNRLTTIYPKATDFGSKVPDERTIGSSDSKYLGPFGVRKEIYKPVTEDKIDAYQEAYSEWENTCGVMLSSLANSLNLRVEWPKLVVSINNIGNRPAEEALVVLEALGDIWIVPPKDEDDENDNSDDINLSAPPSAPKGSWEKEEFFIGSRAMMDFVSANTRSSLFPNHRHDFNLPNLGQRDPNAFYFKRGKRGSPTSVIEYTCKQWRHARRPEDFDLSVGCAMEPGLHSGCVRVTVHASNLTEPTSLNIPVQITIYEKNCMQVAEEIINKLKPSTTHLRNLKG